MAARLWTDKGRLGGRLTVYEAVTDVEKIRSATSVSRSAQSTLRICQYVEVRHTGESCQFISMELFE